jgi:hypothetical protein
VRSFWMDSSGITGFLDLLIMQFSKEHTRATFWKLERFLSSGEGWKYVLCLIH